MLAGTILIPPPALEPSGGQGKRPRDSHWNKADCGC